MRTDMHESLIHETLTMCPVEAWAQKSFCAEAHSAGSATNTGRIGEDLMKGVKSCLRSSFPKQHRRWHGVGRTVMDGIITPLCSGGKVMHTIKPAVASSKFLFLCDKDGNIIGIIPATAA